MINKIIKRIVILVGVILSSLNVNAQDNFGAD